MWYWVGGGFSAVFGTASCLASIFLIMDPEVTKARPWVRTYTCAIHLSTPLAYTVLARWTGWIGQTLWAAFTAWRIWRILRRAPSKPEIPPGRHCINLVSPCHPSVLFMPGWTTSFRRKTGIGLAFLGLNGKPTQRHAAHGSSMPSGCAAQCAGCKRSLTWLSGPPPHNTLNVVVINVS